MVTRSVCALALVAGCGTAARTERPAVEKTRVLPVEADGPVEPSGLALLDGELLSVSDEDEVIFRIVVGESSALMEPWLVIEVPDPRPPELDLEGIAVCEGRIFVLSEGANDVMEVDPSGRSRWIGEGARSAAIARGLLGSPGAGLEGIACAERGGLVLASEREPRALLWLALEEPGRVSSQILDLEDVVGRSFSSDFSDLSSEAGRLWALYRYTYEILEVVGEPGSVALIPVAELSSVALDPRHRYSSTRFGMAEGLALDDGYFYVIDDNNDLPRAEAPADSRPLLFVIPRH
ncbi:MAG: hypothetical protein HYY06_03585 [Deltaproteobacteria bacterium]|nr:hypothetical protein [Deltaproteobacteria bacterium]